MKTNNQTGHSLLELPITKAANDDAVSPAAAREVPQLVRKQGWNPKEVWRTRVKARTSAPHGEPSAV
jgi:hypothetical protein